MQLAVIFGISFAQNHKLKASRMTLSGSVKPNTSPTTENREKYKI